MPQASVRGIGILIKNRRETLSAERRNQTIETINWSNDWVQRFHELIKDAGLEVSKFGDEKNCQ
jgi:hypothetical protein